MDILNNDAKGMCSRHLLLYKILVVVAALFFSDANAAAPTSMNEKFKLVDVPGSVNIDRKDTIDADLSQLDVSLLVNRFQKDIQQGIQFTLEIHNKNSIPIVILDVKDFTQFILLDKDGHLIQLPKSVPEVVFHVLTDKGVASKPAGINEIRISPGDKYTVDFQLREIMAKHEVVPRDVLNASSSAQQNRMVPIPSGKYQVQVMTSISPGVSVTPAREVKLMRFLQTDFIEIVYGK